MIAHSFKGAVFGPAQRLHGATFIVDVAFSRPELGADNIVVDIGRAASALGDILGEVNHRNLDEIAAFDGQNTTTEFMARWVFERMRDLLRGGRLGPGAEAVQTIAVEIAESDVAWASYSGAAR